MAGRKIIWQVEKLFCQGRWENILAGGKIIFAGGKIDAGVGWWDTFLLTGRWDPCVG